MMETNILNVSRKPFYTPPAHCIRFFREFAKPMSNRTISEEPEGADNQKAPSALWNVAVWALALGAFAVAIVLSYREIHYNIPNDLRSPAILVVDAFLATAVAIGFALHEGSLTRWTDAHLCLRFGFWAAAVF